MTAFQGVSLEARSSSPVMAQHPSRVMHPIAVVDDDAGVRNALTTLLEASYDVRAFKNAKDFIAGLAVVVPACAIIDLKMPEMTGLELQQHLSRTGINIPTIVITAHDEDDNRDRCLEAGAAAYMVKPLHKAALMSAIQDAIEGRQCG